MWTSKITMRRLLIVLAAAIIPAFTAVSASAAAPGGTPPNCTPPAIMLEAQSWVFNGSEHVHTRVCWDATRTGSLPSGYQFVTQTLMHHTDSHLRLVRLGTDASILESHSMDIPGNFANEVSRLDTFTVPSAGIDGARELRFTSDDRAPARWYTTTRWQADNAGRVGAAGWCEPTLTRGYTNIYINEADFDAVIPRQLPVPEPWTIRVKAEDDAMTVAVDPALHASPPVAGNPVVVNRGPAGNVERSITIPTQNLAPGVHRLMLVDHDNSGASAFGECAGVFTFPFVVQ